MRSFIIHFSVLVLWSCLVCTAQAALDQTQIIVMLNSGYRSSDIETLIRANGYDGKTDAATLAQLKQNGASLELIDLIAFNLKFKNPLSAADIRAMLLKKSPMSDIMAAIDNKGFQGRLSSSDALEMVTYGAPPDLIKKIQKTAEESLNLDDASFLIIGSNPKRVDQDVVFEKSGFATESGRILIRPQWEEAASFSSNLARVRQGNNYGFIDKTGTLIIPTRFPLAHSFSEDRTVISTVISGDPAFRYITSSGGLLSSDVWEDAGEFKMGKARVSVHGKYGYIDSEGNLVIQPKWSSAGDFKEGLACVGATSDDGSNHYGYINDKGVLVIPTEWEEARDFSDGLAAVKKDGLWGYINPSGKLVIENQYKAARNFSESVAAVNVDYLSLVKWMYIGIKGQQAIAGEWLEAGDFNKGLAQVADSKGRFIINKSGRHQIPEEWTLAKNQPATGVIFVTRTLPDKQIEAAYMDLSGRIIWRSE